ncbi:Rrf2 family transcriptional regulator [Candidatus Giovannonibacteria bacterium]|nr:Rrf2 family transcriptional regulator [Candidatus Giovannonibacteria bacterium]
MKKRIDYGILLIEELKKSPTEFFDVRRIAKKKEIPAAYLEKIAQEFKRSGLIESRRGAGGGYRLAKNASMMEIFGISEELRSFCPLTRKATKLLH